MSARSPVEFENAARERGIVEWRLRGCSICDYQVGYVFRDGDVYWDAGCYCSRIMPPLEPRTSQDVADHYNMQTHPDVIRGYDEFWGFERTP